MSVVKFIIILAFFGSVGCKPKADQSAPSGHYQNGQQFAYGSIILEKSTESVSLELRLSQDVNNIDRRKKGFFELVDSENKDQDVVFVDYGPKERKPTIYNHTITTRLDQNDKSRRNIWMQLVVNAPSYVNSQTKFMYIGYAKMNSADKKGKVVLFEKVNQSRIVVGDSYGSLALHYASEAIRGNPYDRNFCDVILNLPEELKAQTPSGFNPGFCRERLPSNDICDSQPSRKGCRPNIPEGLKNLNDDGLQIFAPKLLKIDSDRFRLVGDETLGLIELRKSGSRLEYQDHSDFLIYTRDSENHVHDHCRLKADPLKSAEAGRLIYQVVFEKAFSYRDKVCNIVFEEIGSGKTDFVQIIRR